MAIILIVDDDAAMRDALAEVVHDLGHDVRLAPSGEEALRVAEREALNAVFLDLRMPGIDGLEVLRHLRARPRPVAVTVLTAHATATNTIEAMRLGAFDHLTKPIGREDVARVLERMLASTAMPRSALPPAEAEALIGASTAMREVQKTIGILADSDATVLITGETGTGKELVARAIHDHGHRRGGPFIAVNCAAIPSELMETELFGHVRGAFTGAVSDRTGAFRQAERGTLFLDEIGDMEVGLQAKILRALEERVVTPVGGKPLHVDVRVIAATHRDLLQRVREGGFRTDLFYRLNVVPINLPALRERIVDIVPLAERFLSRLRGGKGLAPDAAARLVRHSWPGNVRELKNAIERAAVLARGGLIGAADLSFLAESRAVQGDSLIWPDEDLPTALARVEEMLVRRALERSGGNRAEAARMLNINRQLLYTKMKRYRIELSEDPTDGVSRADADPAQRRLVAILAADVAGYSRLMGADEEGTLTALMALRRELLDPKIAEYRGRIVKVTGDGILVEFASVVDAVRCAVEIQVAMPDRNQDIVPDSRIELRIGINLSDVIVKGDDLYGDGVNVAARIEAAADAGNVFISNAAYEHVRDRLPFVFEDLGERQFKNIAHPVRVYRVRDVVTANPRR